LEFSRTKIADIILCKPQVFQDDRGYFFETFKEGDLEEFIEQPLHFCQDNESKSGKGVLRGLHYQLGDFAQSKLVRVVKGAVLDVAVDIRKGSSTFGAYVAIELNDVNKYQMYIPKGFAHGYVVLSEEAIFSYKVDQFYNQLSERGIAFDDSDLQIDWNFPMDQILISEKDTKQPSFLKAEIFNLR